MEIMFICLNLPSIHWKYLGLHKEYHGVHKQISSKNYSSMAVHRIISNPC
jgi:hypothetical protein